MYSSVHSVSIFFLNKCLIDFLPLLLHPALEPEDNHDDDDGAARHEPEDEEAIRGLE